MIIAKELIFPKWESKPKSVKAFVTTRHGGVSSEPYQSLNLGDHVGDCNEDVIKNRAMLLIDLPSTPIWLNQTHGTQVSSPISRQLSNKSVIEADAAVTDIPNEVLSILSADCLPALFTSADGRVIGAAHAGWRGLCHGVLENTVVVMQSLQPKLLVSDISVWLGPAIGPSAFEVGVDVMEAFMKQAPIPANAFLPIQNKPGKFLANLYLLAQSRLNAIGVTKIEGGEFCTYSDQSQFFSYRRDGKTGRFATVIWLTI